MYTEDNLFTVEVFCELCGSDDCEISFLPDDNKLVVKCNECGTVDFISLSDI